MSRGIITSVGRRGLSGGAAVITNEGRRPIEPEAPVVEPPEPARLAISSPEAGSTLAGTSVEIVWRARDGQRYDVWVGSIPGARDISDSVGLAGAGASPYTVTGVPADGRELHVTLFEWPEGGVVADGTSVSMALTANGEPAAGMSTAGMTALTLPAQDVGEGSFTDPDWRALVAPRSSVYWDGSGDAITSVGTHGGRRALQVRLQATGNANRPSTRVNAGFALPPAQSARLRQFVRFAPGFSFGSSADTRYQTGKMGFGFRGGDDRSGGRGPAGNAAITPTGFTARLIHRRGAFGLYTYSADTAGFGDDHDTGIAIQTGRWYLVEMDCKMNSSTGASDGWLRAWIDGASVLDKRDFRWFGASSPQIDMILLNAFAGGSGSTLYGPENPSYLQLAEPAAGPGTW